MRLHVAELHVAGRGVAVARGSLAREVVVTVRLQLETRLLEGMENELGDDLDNCGEFSDDDNSDQDDDDDDGERDCLSSCMQLY